MNWLFFVLLIYIVIQIAALIYFIKIQIEEKKAKKQLEQLRIEYFSRVTDQTPKEEQDKILKQLFKKYFEVEF